MNLQRILPILAAILALSGCAGVPERGDESRDVIELLDFYGRLVALPSDEQHRVYQEAQTDFERQPGDVQRLRLALALTLPRAPWGNDARALQLVDSIAGLPRDKPSPRRDLALALQKLVGEKLRLLREEQQKQQGLLAERQRQLRDEHRTVEELQGKLDALRAIDRDIRRKTTR